MVNPYPRIPQPAPGRREQPTPVKTVLIYDQCGEVPIKFAVLDGDFSHLDRIYINMATKDSTNRRRQDELSSLVYDKAGQTIMRFYDKFPYKAMGPNTKVIVAGFLP